jgi:hypothetical protein
MMRKKRRLVRAVGFAVAAAAFAIVADACSFETIFRAYLGKTLWNPTWKYVSELTDGLPPENADHVPYAGMSSGGGSAGLQDVREAYRDLFPEPSGVLRWPDPVIADLRKRVRSATAADADEAHELELLQCKIELRALRGIGDPGIGQVRSCFESYLAKSRPDALASEARGWLARTAYLEGKGAIASKIYMSELASQTSNIRRERLLESLRMVKPQEEELDEYFDTAAHALFAADQITSADGPQYLAGPLITRLERHENLFGRGAESNKLAIALMRASLRLGAPEATLRYAERIPPTADMRRTAEYNWLAGAARFQQKDYPGAQVALMNVMNAKDADDRQKAYAANALIGVYARLNRPVDELWASFRAKSLSSSGSGGGGAQMFPVYPFYYYEMSRAGVFGYIDFDAPYLLDAELTDSELERSLKHTLMEPSDLAQIQYALAVRYARREKYAEAAQIYDQLSSPRAGLMRQAANLFAATKAAGAPKERQLEALYNYAEFLSQNEDGIFFNDTLWQGFQDGVVRGASADDAGRSAQLERRLRDDQEEYWRAYQILNRVVSQAGPTPLGKKAASLAISCLRKIRTERFGRAEEISRADLRLSSWLQRN